SGSSDSHSGYPTTSWCLFTRLSSCSVSGWLLIVVSFRSATRAAWWGFGVVGLRSRASSGGGGWWLRSEEHTSELQSRFDLVCRLLLEKKNLCLFCVLILL